MTAQTKVNLEEGYEEVTGINVPCTEIVRVETEDGKTRYRLSK